MLRIVCGLALVYAGVALGFELGGETGTGSAVGGGVAVSIASVLFFARADALDQIRWRRSLSASAVAYLLIYLPTVLVTSGFTDDVPEAGIFCAAAVLSVFVGILHVRLRDWDDRRDVVRELRKDYLAEHPSPPQG